MDKMLLKMCQKTKFHAAIILDAWGMEGAEKFHICFYSDLLLLSFFFMKLLVVSKLSVVLMKSTHTVADLCILIDITKFHHNPHAFVYATIQPYFP